MKQREIKFRGKRKSGTEWIIGDVNFINGLTYIFDRSSSAPLNSPDWFEVQPETVGQFTGLLDREGLDIYEGDIIRSNASGTIATVTFDNGTFMWDHEPLGYDLFSEPEAEVCLPERWATVIGNIYENENLLTPTK